MFTTLKNKLKIFKRIKSDLFMTITCNIIATSITANLLFIKYIVNRCKKKTNSFYV